MTKGVLAVLSVQVEYKVELRVLPAGVGHYLWIHLPITIGVMPLKEFIIQFSPAVPQPNFADSVWGEVIRPGLVIITTSCAISTEHS